MMKVLCDVHISYKLVKYLNNKGITSIHINEILDRSNTKDSEICKYADKNDFVLVSKDIDFRNSFFIQNTPRKLIRIILGNITNQELITIFDKNLEFFIENFKTGRCYIEVYKDYISLIKA